MSLSNLSNKIAQYLAEGGSFADGLALFQLTGNQERYHQLRQYLSFPLIPPAGRKALHEALQAYLLVHPVQVANPVPAPAPRPPEGGGLPAAPQFQNPNPQPLQPPPDPPAIQRLRNEGRHLLRERDARRAQLVQMAEQHEKYTDNDRYRLAEEIMAIQQDIDYTYQQIDAYHHDGTLPAVGNTDAIVQDTVAKMQRINSLRSAVSRLRKRLTGKKMDAKQRQTLTIDLNDKTAELEALEEELGLNV